jgi:hypothetical protein
MEPTTPVPLGHLGPFQLGDRSEDGRGELVLRVVDVIFSVDDVCLSCFNGSPMMIA